MIMGLIIPIDNFGKDETKVKFLSICSGIDAASVAFAPLGWVATGFSEIEPFPCAVLKHHYPDVPNFGDMTRFRHWPVQTFIDADVIVGGPPCQSFSLAGLRNGLEDARGNLTLTYAGMIDYADEIRTRNGKPPVVVLYENVPGILSDKTNAFGSLLAALAGENVPLNPSGGKWTHAGAVFGPKRAVAWRVTDAQYFGVAQRRRRVFVVASAREGVDPTEILFEFDGLRRDSPPSREAGKGIARSAAFSAGNSSGSRSIAYVEEGSPPLRAGSSGTNQVPTCVFHESYSTSGAGYWREGIGALRGRPQDSHENVLCVHGTQDPCVSTTTAFALGRNNGGENAIAFAQNSRDEVRLMGGDGQIVGALAAEPGMKQTCYVAQPINIYGGNKRADRPEGGFYVRIDEDTSKTLDSATGLNPTCSQGGTAVLQPIGLDEELNAMIDTFGTLKARTAGGGFEGSVMQTNMQVRRLAPVECERLQSFPDGYTMIPWRNKPANECPDGPRYKALGNSWCVNNVRWIGKRIQLQLTKE